MKKNILRIAVFIAILFSFMPVFMPQAIQAAPAYTVDGNKVYTGNSDYFLQAEPATLTASGWVTVTLKTTSYTGAIDIVYGFDGMTNVQPLKQEIWESYEHTLYNNVEVTKTDTIMPSKIIKADATSQDLVAFGSIDKTLNAKVAVIETTDKYGTRQSALPYNTTDGKSFTYSYKTIEAQPYKQTFEDWNKLDVMPTKISKNYAGAVKWDEIKTQRNITAGNFYVTRVWIDIPFNGTNAVSGKYNIGIKPSALTLDQSISQNKFWLLDPWYSSSWLYRKSYTISHAAGAVSNYQFPLKIYYGAGADGTEAVEGLTAGKMYTNSLCQTDFDDIRVTDSTGNTLQDIWLESKTDSDNAVFWVEHNSIGVGATTFYVYYGNAAAASVSSGANTFIVFDDFERGVDGDNIGGSWTIDAGNVKISTDHAYGGTRSTRVLGVVGTGSAAHITANSSANISIRTRVWKEDATTNTVEEHGNATYRGGWVITSTEDLYYYDGALKDTGSNVTADAWQLIETNKYDYTAHTFDIYLNGNLAKASATMANLADRNNMVLVQNQDTNAGRDAYYDNLIVRNWSSTEPAWGAWGSESSRSCAVTGTVTTAVETDIVAGGKTIILTLTNDTWITAGAAFNAIRQDIIDGLDSAGAEAHGWNVEVRDKIPVTDVVRTGDTVVTITLTAEAGYDITALETITVTVPASALTAAGALTASPTFDIAAIVPIVVTGLCTGFGDTWAILNGTITTPATGVTQIVFEYGLTTGYGSLVSEVGVYVSGTNYSLVLTGLTPATVYHYRFGASSGSFGYGADATFATHGSASSYECYTTGGDANGADIYGANWAYQTFTTTQAHTVTEIWLYIQKTGTPGTITTSIRKTSAGVPTGVDLCTATYAGASFATSHSWYKFVPTTTISLEASTMYAIVVNNTTGDNANDVQWRWDAGGGLANGNAGHSTDNGSSWTTDAPADQLFCIWGYPALNIEDAKVFNTYLATGDWLITVRYNNFYPPYYDTYDIKRYFDIQLVDASANVIATSPMPRWGYSIGSVYLSAAQAGSLSIGGDYRIRLYGKFGSNPYYEYALISTDWLGSDLTRLDSWVITSASTIGTYYSKTFTTYIAGRGEVLNTEGGVLFDTGIPGLSTVRPLLFQTYTSTNPYIPVNGTQAGKQAMSQWQPHIGADGTVAMTRMGNIFGIDGSAFLSGIFLLLSFSCAVFGFKPGNSTPALFLSIIPLVGGVAFGVNMLVIGAIALISAFLLVKILWIDKVG